MATTIYTYLHNDDLNGSRIVSMDDCMCKLYNIKRNDSAFMHDFNSDLQKPALYLGYEALIYQNPLMHPPAHSSLQTNQAMAPSTGPNPYHPQIQLSKYL